MTYLFFAVVLLLVLAQTWLDAYQIKKGKSINHAGESLLFAGAVFALAWCFIGISGSDFELWKWLAFCAVATLLTRMAIYDFALNLFRGLRLSYSSKTTGSAVDQLERRLGINENVVRWACVALWVAALVFHNRVSLF